MGCAELSALSLLDSESVLPTPPRRRARVGIRALGVSLANWNGAASMGTTGKAGAEI